MENQIPQIEFDTSDVLNALLHQRQSLQHLATQENLDRLRGEMQANFNTHERKISAIDLTLTQFNRSFTGIDQRFDQSDKRFGQIDSRFEQIDRRFEQIDRRFEQVDQRFEQVDQRFEQVNQRFEQVDKQFKQVDKRFDKLEGKFDRLQWFIVAAALVIIFKDHIVKTALAIAS